MKKKLLKLIFQHKEQEKSVNKKQIKHETTPLVSKRFEHKRKIKATKHKMGETKVEKKKK